jgi:hypothetical protein
LEQKEMESYEKPKLRSLGKLRKTPKTKERSPDLTGKLEMQRHTFEALAAQFANQDGDTLVCNIAAWINRDGLGEYLTTEISPRFVSRQTQQPERPNLRFVFGDSEESDN